MFASRVRCRCQWVSHGCFLSNIPHLESFWAEGFRVSQDACPMATARLRILSIFWKRSRELYTLLLRCWEFRMIHIIYYHIMYNSYMIYLIWIYSVWFFGETHAQYTASSFIFKVSLSGSEVIAVSWENDTQDILIRPCNLPNTFHVLNWIGYSWLLCGSNILQSVPLIFWELEQLQINSLEKSTI